MTFTNKGYGAFEATNGYDTIHAAFTRKARRDDGRMRPVYALNYNGQTYTVDGDKNDAMLKAEELLAMPMPHPLTEKESVRQQKHEGCVHGVVEVFFNDMVGSDIEVFLNTLNDRVSEMPLQELDYHVVGFASNGNSIYVRVQGYIDEDDISSGGEIVSAEFTSVWDGEATSVSTACMVNLKTREVFDITQVDVQSVSTLDHQYITLEDGREFPVFEADEAGSEGFWDE